MTNETLVIDAFSLTQSWGGFALDRSAAEFVTPYIVPGLDSGGRTNLDTLNAGVRFWFTPRWSSSSVDHKSSGPGAEACLAELQAVGKGDSVVIWQLRVSPDGSTISLLQETEIGLIEMLSGEIAWAAGSPHCLALNYGRNGSQLFVDGQFLANGNGTLGVPSETIQFALGSTITGAEIAGGDFDELFTFSAPRRADFALSPLAAR